MGLFASRAQEPFEWAGLPSEPLTPRGNAEFLEDPPVDPFAIVSGGGTASIAISLTSPPAAEPQAPAPSDAGECAPVQPD